jgi:hypothetical protein
MLNAKLHHPEQIKPAAIGNTIKTYTSICSTDALFEEAERKFERRALRNGYSINYIKKARQQNENCQNRKSNLFLHSLPEALHSIHFQTFYLRHPKSGPSNLNFRIVERSQSSLKQLLVELKPYNKVRKDTSSCPTCSNSNSPIRCAQKDVVLSCNKSTVTFVEQRMKVRQAESKVL